VKRIRLVLVTAAAFILGIAAAAWAATPKPVVASSLDEKTPAGSSTYLAWAQNSSGAPNHFDAFVRKGTGSKRKVNPAGTAALLGGIDGTALIFQQIKGSQSNIKLYNLVTKIRSSPPAGVNTSAWEWLPTTSGSRILFGRGNPANHNIVRRVIVFDSDTGDSTVIARTRSGIFSVVPGQVNGGFATWWVCTSSRCDVFRRNLATGTTVKVPNPSGKLQYAPSVTSTGDVTFARSGFNCGSGVQLRRFHAGSVTKLAALPTGADVGQMFAYTASGKTTVLFDRVKCAAQSWDVYKLVTG
jgi:hypothetical protein